MPLRPVHNRSLGDDIFEQLAAAIMQGDYAPGDKLPAERTLVEVFGVNRHVVREALKRLQQVGLLQISQGGGTTVLDYRTHAGLDLLSLMAEHARVGKDVSALWRSVLEMRAAIGIDMSRLCAMRASDHVRAELLQLADAMAAAPRDEIYALEVRFWDLVLEGCGNLAYRLAFNSMVKGSAAAGELSVQWSARESKAADYRRPLARAIAAGDAEEAEAETRRTMRAAVAAFEQAAGLPSEPAGKPGAKRGAASDTTRDGA